MELPVIHAIESVVEPAQIIPEQIYDRYWLASLVVQAFDPNKNVSASIELVKYGIDQDGKVVIAPNSSVVLNIQNVMEKAATNLALAQTMGAILNCVIILAQEQGLVPQ